MHRACLALLGLAVLAGGLQTGVGQAQNKKRVYTIDGKKGEIPKDWVWEKPANRLRYLQFKLPKAAGDPVDAQLVITKGIGGKPTANVARWIKQFIPPPGKTSKDVAKVTEMKLIKGEGWYLDVYGTFLYKSAPFDPRAKTERRPNHRMIGIHYEGDDDVYHFKLVGPAKTVAKHKKGFDAWIKGLK